MKIGWQDNKNNLLHTYESIRNLLKEGEYISRTRNTDQFYVYHLRIDDINTLRRETVFENRSSIQLLACKDRLKAVDNHYSWGYFGTGCDQMAYTILYDYFNSDYTLKSEAIEPTGLEKKLFMYRIISLLHNCFDYKITSAQIDEALSNESVESFKNSCEKVLIEHYKAA